MFYKETRDFELNHLNKKGGPVLENFWAKVSKASYSRNLLKVERKKLLKENSHLQALLREYCVQEQVGQNLSTLGFTTGKNLKSGIVSQDASVIPQIKNSLLKFKHTHKS